MQEVQKEQQQLALNNQYKANVGGYKPMLAFFIIYREGLYDFAKSTNGNGIRTTNCY